MLFWSSFGKESLSLINVSVCWQFQYVFNWPIERHDCCRPWSLLSDIWLIVILNAVTSEVFLEYMQISTTKSPVDLTLDTAFRCKFPRKPVKSNNGVSFRIFEDLQQGTTYYSINHDIVSFDRSSGVSSGVSSPETLYLELRQLNI